MFLFLSKKVRFLAFKCRGVHPLALAPSAMLVQGVFAGLLVIPIYLLVERPGHDPIADHYQMEMLRSWGALVFFVRAVIIAPVLETFLLQVCLLEPAKFDYSLYREVFRDPKRIVFVALFSMIAVGALVLDWSRSLIVLYVLNFLILELPILGLLEFARRHVGNPLYRRRLQRAKLSVAFVVSAFAFACGHLKPGAENLIVFVCAGLVGGIVFAFVYLVYPDPPRSIFTVWTIHFLPNFLMSTISMIPSEIHLMIRLVLFAIVLITYYQYRKGKVARNRRLPEEIETDADYSES